MNKYIIVLVKRILNHSRGDRTKMSSSTPESGGKHVVESETLLSRSVLWKQMRNFYETQGTEAWSKGIVPSFITSNTFIADAYAKVFYAFVEDLISVGALNNAEPLSILELGAGSGKFCFHFLNALLLRYERKNGRGYDGNGPFRIRYIMTDLSVRNVKAWSNNLRLKKFADIGVLDFAEFDVERHSSLRLEVAGIRISQEKPLLNPLVVIANYVFDSLPCDVFRLDRTGRLLEGRATVLSSENELDSTHPRILDHCETKFSWHEVEAGQIDNFYESERPGLNKAFAALFHRYRESFAGQDATINFPKGSIQCLQTINAFAEQMFVLSGDKGISQTGLMNGLSEPHIACHGSFSMMVNFHALGKWFQEMGGSFLHSSIQNADLHISLFLLYKEIDPTFERCENVANRCGNWIDPFPAVKLAFEDFLDSFGPTDFFSLQAMTDCSRHTSGLYTLDTILSMIRLSRYDPDVFYKLRDAIASRTVCVGSQAAKADIKNALSKVWANFFFLEEGADVPYEIGRVCYAMQAYEEAIRYYYKSQQLFGEYYITDYNVALAYTGLGDTAMAQEHVQRALQLNPDYDNAIRLKLDLEDRKNGVRGRTRESCRAPSPPKSPRLRNKNSLTHRTTIDPDVLTRNRRWPVVPYESSDAV